MANVKISGLPAAAAAASSDEYPANQVGTTNKVTGTQISTLVRGTISGTAPVSYVSATGVISMAASSGSVDGYLTAANFTTFSATSSANSVDVTLAAFGSTPNSNGASLSAQALTLQPADGTNPGGVSTTTQTIAGAKTFTGNTLIANNAASVATIGGSSSTAIHQINGGIYFTTRTITGNLTLDTTTSDYLIFVTTSSGAISITFPAPVNGRVFVIKDISGQAQTNNITMVRNGSEQIEGIAASKVLTTNWGSWTFVSDSTNWYMI